MELSKELQSKYLYSLAHISDEDDCDLYMFKAGVEARDAECKELVEALENLIVNTKSLVVMHEVREIVSKFKCGGK